MQNWKCTCPNQKVTVNLTMSRLSGKICPACSEPLIPDHLTKQEREKMIATTVGYKLDGNRFE
jgi:hypothetical protein